MCSTTSGGGTTATNIRMGESLPPRTTGFSSAEVP